MIVWPISPAYPLKPSTTIPFQIIALPMPSDIKISNRSAISVSFAAEQIALASATASLQTRMLASAPSRSLSMDFRSTLRHPRNGATATRPSRPTKPGTDTPIPRTRSRSPPATSIARFASSASRSVTAATFSSSGPTGAELGDDGHCQIEEDCGQRRGRDVQAHEVGAGGVQRDADAGPTDPSSLADACFRRRSFVDKKFASRRTLMALPTVVRVTLSSRAMSERDISSDLLRSLRHRTALMWRRMLVVFKCASPLHRKGPEGSFMRGAASMAGGSARTIGRAGMRLARAVRRSSAGSAGSPPSGARPAGLARGPTRAP